MSTPATLTGRCTTCGVTIRPTGQRCACEPEPAVPWQVHRVTVTTFGSGVHLEGTNHYTGERFNWGLFHHGLVWSYRERFGRFRGATFGPGARKALAALLRLARRDGGAR